VIRKVATATTTTAAAAATITTRFQNFGSWHANKLFSQVPVSCVLHSMLVKKKVMGL
jgi:hypothetical protein